MARLILRIIKIIAATAIITCALMAAPAIAIPGSGFSAIRQWKVTMVR